MASARTTWGLSVGAACAAAALALIGCSGSHGTTGGDDGGGGDGGQIPDGGLTIPDGGTPPASLFPLALSADRGSLVADDGTPFLLHGEAAWSLIAQLNTTDAMRYLADRRTRGVTAVIVNLIEHQYSDRAPANAAGDAPFTTPGDFTKPNEKYFGHADQVIDIAAAQGIAVLLVPAYLGFNGGNEGWFSEMSAMTEPQCRAYGDFVGRRYAARSNIIWVWGGDYTPPSGDPGETCLKAIRDGILAAAPAGTLSTGHWEPESTSRDEPAFASAIDIVGLYTYLDILGPCRSMRAATPRKPTFLFETCYENETIRSCAGTTAEVRRRQWWGFLGCGAGEISGNAPIWEFGSGWPQALVSPLSSSQVRLTTIAHSIRWQALAPDDALITAGGGSGYTEVAAARTIDAGPKQALVYFPPGSASSVTLNLSLLGSSVTATWQDPSALHSMSAGTSLNGSHAFAKPGKNGGGDSDWVLVLTTE
jgi:hypothetical protein